MGSLFSTRLADTIKQVTVIDLHKETSHPASDIRYIQADVSDLDKDAQNALSMADLVIAALPETVLMAAWQGIIACQKESSLFVDTLSVKTPIIQAVTKSTAPNEIISINPMFAPSLGFAGQGIAVIDVRRGPIANAFTKLLETWGSHLVSLTAKQHDRTTAMLQALTHAAILAFGTALQSLSYDLKTVEPIMAPPHRTLLALLARILSTSPEVYWDIQASNPYAAEARHAFMSGNREFSKLIDSENQPDFEKLLASIHSLFDPAQLENYQEICARIFTSFTPTN